MNNRFIKWKITLFTVMNAFTIGLTVLSILLIGIILGQKVILGLQGVDLILLITTIVVSLVTFSSNRTNAIHGIVHLILFASYIVMMFDCSELQHGLTV